MAFQTQRPDVAEIALAAAFHHRHKVIGIPECLSCNAPGRPPEPPVLESFQAGNAAKALQLTSSLQAIDAAAGAHAAIALQHFLAQVPGIASQPPFFHAPVRAERLPARRNLEIAPAAEAPAVNAFGQISAVCPAAGHGSFGTHVGFVVTILSCKNQQERNTMVLRGALT